MESDGEVIYLTIIQDSLYEEKAFPHKLSVGAKFKEWEMLFYFRIQ